MTKKVGSPRNGSTVLTDSCCDYGEYIGLTCSKYIARAYGSAVNSLFKKLLRAVAF